MRGVFGALDRLIVALSFGAAAIAAALVFAMGVSIVTGILARMLGIPLAWPTDIVPHLLLLAVMLAAPEAFRRGEHIAVDLIVTRLGAGALRVVNVWACASVAFLSLLLIKEGMEMVSFSRMSGMRSHDRLDLQLWWIQSVVPVGSTLLLLNALRGLIIPPKAHAIDEVSA